MSLYASYSKLSKGFKNCIKFYVGQAVIIDRLSKNREEEEEEENTLTFRLKCIVKA